MDFEVRRLLCAGAEILGILCLGVSNVEFAPKSAAEGTVRISLNDVEVPLIQ